MRIRNVGLSALKSILITCATAVCLSFALTINTALAQSGSTEHVFYVDANANLDELWWSNSTGWVFQQPIGGGGMVASGSSLSGFHDSFGEHVFFLDPNQHVHQLFWSSSAGWSNQDLTATTGGHLAMAGTGLTSFRDSVGEHLFYLEGALPNACVVQLFWSQSTGWERQSLQCGADGSALTGFQDSFGEHVFYFSADITIHQLLWTSNAGWHDQRLPSTEQSFTAQDGLASFSDSTGEHVFYVGGGATVWQLYWSQSVGWQNQNTPSGSLAQSGASLTGFSDSHGESVFYIQVGGPGVNLVPHILRWTQSSGWQDSSLGLPLVYATSPLTSFTDSFGEHLIYLSQASPQCCDNPPNVEQFLAPNGSTWGNQDLSTLSNAPFVPMSNPSLSSLTSFD